MRFQADDDTFVHRTRLQRDLSMLNPSVPLYLGRNVGQKDDFCHGGAGYILSRGALEMIGPHLHLCKIREVSRDWEAS